MLVLISVKTGLSLWRWANVVVALRVEVALHDILVVVPIVCVCPTAWGIGNLHQYFSLQRIFDKRNKSATLFFQKADDLTMMRDGFETELSSYGQGGRVLGPVVGAFAEMSDDVKELANAVAEELAVEHCSFYGDNRMLRRQDV